MVDFKDILKNTKETLTTPTAYSWYGAVGVVATGVLTFFATKKWVEFRSDKRDIYWDEAEDEIIRNDNDSKVTLDEAIRVSETYFKKLKDRPFKEKLKEAANTALIFAPPVLTAAGASWSIIYGNRKAMAGLGRVIEMNTNLASRLDQCKPFGAGVLAGKILKEDDEKPVPTEPHRLYFCEDDLQHEDYGEPAKFLIQRLDDEVIEFVSTPLEVMMAECEFNKLIWSDRIGEFGSLNELLDMMHAPKVDDGDYCGWSKHAGFKNGYTWVGFTHTKIDKDKRVYLITFESEPTYDELFEKWIHG